MLGSLKSRYVKNVVILQVVTLRTAARWAGRFLPTAPGWLMPGFRAYSVGRASLP
jgi:hypothetical protein